LKYSGTPSLLSFSVSAFRYVGHGVAKAELHIPKIIFFSSKSLIVRLFEGGVQHTERQKDRSDGVTGDSFKEKQCHIRRKRFRIVTISAISNNKIIERKK
jgi:hypothetical protein